MLTVCCLSEHCIARSIRVIIIIIIKGKGVLVHSMSACRGVDLQLFSFLTLAVNEIE